MVLQAAPSQARIWGWTSAASQTVTVVLGNGIQSKKVLSSSTAPFAWSVDLDPVAASFTAFTITVTSGSASARLDNVLFGEVFICSGQSNMQMSVAAAFNATQVCRKSFRPPISRLQNALFRSGNRQRR